ncbi:L-type lectin-domain containing receptor kinase IX.1-like [Dorcoceras hygrometricum]|uniref:L-type lectin-domain containing receptor kinase IX.1-like n=1 Tax=Dorcoceras hygrometricum TaxID=472368 RepID=A0A2Z7C6H2_9LAMI|nr:L-type lectin-domain containing receptor kinase IX.1-like [Dorcoceras hygrometricum]
MFLPRFQQLRDVFKEELVFDFEYQIPYLENILPIVDLCFSNPSTVHREFLRRFPVDSGHRFHDRGSVGLLSRSSFILYQYWRLWLASCGARSCCPVPVLRSSGVGIESLGLVFVVTVAQKYKPCSLLYCAVVSYQDARASGNTALSSPCWDLLATMRRVVNYHSSWARQQQVELFDASGNLGFTAGRGFNPAGGAPGGG